MIRSGEPAEISVTDIATFLLRQRRIILVVTLVSVAGSLALALLLKPYYTCTAKFVPSENADLVSRMGTLIGTGKVESIEDSGTGEYYKELITSSQFVSQLAERSYPSRRFDQPQPLDRLIQVPTGEPAARMAQLGDRLRRSIDVSVARQSGIVTVQFTSPDPVLAAAVVNRVVDQLIEWNESAKASKAKRNREFVESQLKEAQVALDRAEKALTGFSSQNRRIATPTVQMEADRLKRDVDVQTEVVLTLRKQYELSRIEEQEKRPFVEVIERGAVPLRKTGPRRALILVLGGLLGGGLALGVAFLVDGWQRLHRRPDSNAELLAELEGLRKDVTTLGGLLSGQRGKQGREADAPFSAKM